MQCMHACMHVCMHGCMYEWMNECVYVYMCICVHVYMCICIYNYMYVLYICRYVYMYIYIYEISMKYLNLRGCNCWYYPAMYCPWHLSQLDIGRLDPWLFLFAQKGRCGRCWCCWCCSLCWCCRECWCWCCRWCFLVVDDDDDNNNAIAILEVPDFHKPKWIQLSATWHPWHPWCSNNGIGFSMIHIVLGSFPSASSFLQSIDRVVWTLRWEPCLGSQINGVDENSQQHPKRPVQSAWYVLVCTEDLLYVKVRSFMSINGNRFRCSAYFSILKDIYSCIL